MNQLIKTENTILTIEQITHALKEGWFMALGNYPEVNQLAVLWAQVCLETGRGKFIRNYNFGNIKKTKDHDYCQYDCGEWIKGKFYNFVPPHPETSFNSYPSAEQGAKEYIEFLINKKNYQPAWQQVLKGDPAAYCAALKAGGYFTEPLENYTPVVVKLCQEFKSKADKLMAWAPPVVPVEEVKPDPLPEPIIEPEVDLKDSGEASLGFFEGMINKVKDIWKL